MERIKLLWDFKGPNAERTAIHHVKHLNEFIESEGLSNSFARAQVVSPTHHIAFMVVEKIEMDRLRKQLKPHRGQLYKD